MKTLTFLLLGLLTPLAAQNRIHVNVSAGAGGDGTTWALAYTSLQDALTAAGISVGDDEIWVAAGTYTPDPGGTDTSKKFQLASGVAIYGGFVGGESNLGDRNPDPATNGTVLSGDLLSDDAPDFSNRSDNSLRVVETTGVDNTAMLDGFTIRGGAASFAAGGGLGGTGSPLIQQCIFSDNQSGYAGGAVGLSAGAAAVFSDCQFVMNQAVAFGGAVDCSVSPATFIRCTFEGNTSGDRGGAILNYASATTFSHCKFRSNEVTNSAFGGNGTGAGGAIYFWETSIPALHNCTFTGNKGIFGGAIYLFNAQPALTNVTVSGNQATTLGGGIYAGFGAAPQFSNCVVWNNSSAGANTSLDASIYLSGATPSFTHSIVEHSGGSSSWDAAAGTDAGSNQDADPLFATSLDPATAPSTAGDFSLTAGSPAIDAGLSIADLDGAGSGTDTIASIPTDLATNTRIDGSAIEAGAYEYPVGSTPTSFADSFPALDAGQDDNQNGRSNFLDYALGSDPTADHDPSGSPAITGKTVIFTHRNGASDVIPIYKKSSTLDNWTPMQPGVDYSAISSSISGGKVVVSLTLLTDPESDPVMFYVQDFPEP